jgi:hypothetical protein
VKKHGHHDAIRRPVFTLGVVQLHTPSRAHRPLQQSPAPAQPAFPLGMQPHAPSLAQKLEQHSES